MQKASIQERLQGAIWGQFIGDAAGLGSQHIEDIHKRFPKGIQGFEPPEHDSWHSNKTSGDFTHYGDAALLLLQSLVFRQGFSVRDFGTRFLETFASPQYHNYVDQCVQETIKNYQLSLEESHPDLGYEFQGGSNNNDIDTATRLAPLLAFYWNDPDLLSIVDKATRVTQNNELAVAYMRLHAKITRNIFHGEDLKESFRKEIHPKDGDTPFDQHAKSKLLLAFDMLSQNAENATLQLGNKSPLDQSFPSAVIATIKHENSFTEGILSTIRCGGDGSGRASLVGTWLGAYLGNQSIPETWKSRLKQGALIEHYVGSLFSSKEHSF